MTSTDIEPSVAARPTPVVDTPPSRDRLALAAILVLAAVLRFVNLPARGEWDQDQGQQMLALLAWVRDGQVPLLGPATIGTHHPAGFYYLLAPGAFLTDANPVAAVVTLAVIGLVGVAATWWLGRTIGGRLAGHVAGLLMAIRPRSVRPRSSGTRTSSRPVRRSPRPPHGRRGAARSPAGICSPASARWSCCRAISWRPSRCPCSRRSP